MSSFRPRSHCAALVMVCALLAGCKTQQDAVAAATQMAATAKTMAAYYTSLDHVLAETQDAYQAQFALLGIEGEELSETRKEVQLRADMAKQIGNLSTLFQKLTGPAEASDASAAAAKKDSSGKSGSSAADLLGGVSASVESSSSASGASGGGAGSAKKKTESPVLSALSSTSPQYKAVSAGIDEIVALIREHEEAKAAKRIAPVCDNLMAFFDSEQETYDSINQAYLVTARAVARKMVQNNQVDASAVFVSSLQPFGLTAAIDDAKIKTAMQEYLLAQIDTQYALKLKSAQEATEALDQALKEMDARVKLVAGDKPMTLRMPPFSLETVQSWISQVSK